MGRGGLLFDLGAGCVVREAEGFVVGILYGYTDGGGGVERTGARARAREDMGCGKDGGGARWH